MDDGDRQLESAPLLAGRRSGGRTKLSASMKNSLRRISKLARDRVELKKARGGRGHSFWFSLVNEHSHRKEAKVFRGLVTALILANVAAFILQSDERLDQRFKTCWDSLEASSSIVFLIEYCIRVYSRPESRKYAGLDPNTARLKWMISFGAIVDLLSILPWFIETHSRVILRVSGRGRAVSLPNLTWLRVLRLFRLLKSSSIMEAFDVFARVAYFNADILLVALLLCGILLLVLATMLYYMAPKEANQEEDYSSILATLYLSVMMLTGQGQPGGTLPWYTKLICAITAIFAVAQFAIPASMLTWGFEQEAERRIKKKHEERTKQLMRIKNGQAGTSEDLSSDSSDGNSDDLADEWKEYEGIVVGDSDEESEQKPNKMENLPKSGTLSAKEYARVLKVFSALDADESGTIATKDLLSIEGMNSESLARQLDPNGDGFTECEDFVDWLCMVKGSHEALVFDMLLSDLESVRKRAVMDRPAMQAGGIAVGSVSEQLMAFAEMFKNLQGEVARLQREVSLKDKEIARLKGGK